MKLTLFIIFVLGCSLTLIKSDIPTHCLQHQMLGDWQFYQTDSKEITVPELYKHTCGIADHTKVSEINKFNMDKSLFSNSFKIRFNKDHSVNIFEGFKNFNKLAKHGKWTMVYDEGFEFNLGNKDTAEFSSYFAFLKYSTNDGRFPEIKSKHYSHCHQTLIGWYHIENKKWGCFYGHKLVDNYRAPTNGEASDKLIVLENSVVSAFVEINTKESKREKILKSIGNERFMQTEIQSNLENKIASKTNTATSTYLKLNNQFTNHAEVVARINSLNLGWKAEVYEEFKGKTISQLNKFSGRKSKGGHYSKFQTDNHYYHKKTMGLKVEKNKKISKRLQNGETRKKSLKQIDYRSYLGPAKSQGRCGSCFAVATNTMIEARLRVKYHNIIERYYEPKKFLISLDHILKCSFYNQGCHGGYSYLVNKFFKEFEIMTDDCFDAHTCSNKCVAQNTKNSKLKIKVDDYYYVGKYYGYSTEENIYKDLLENGPLVISLAPNYLFSSYRSGIFDADANTWKQLNIQQPEWQKVDHSVVLVGYGVENGTEYWIIQNSWGDNWGENGFMRLRKGKNLINIESLGEAAIVSLTEEK